MTPKKTPYKKPVEKPAEKPAEKPEPKFKKFRVLKGASFKGQPGKPSRRIKPGQVVDDLPERVVDSLLRQGAIEEVK